MEISIKMENSSGRRTMAVYASGRCVRNGLTEAEAGALAAKLINEQFAKAKV